MDWKKLAQTLLLPHAVFVWIFTPAALALLIYSAVCLKSTDVISIISYVLSFYALVLVSMRVPHIVRFAKRFKRENRYAVRYASDVRLRINLSLYRSIAFGAVYAAFQLGLGLWHRSAWFYSMAGYYLLLTVMRLLLIRCTKKRIVSEELTTQWRTYRLCGSLLLTMTLVLAVFIAYFVFRIREFEHHEITTIAMAAYTFSALTVAIIGVVRCRSYGSPVYSAAKAISLVSASVSVLTLENAMLTAFGSSNDEMFRQIMLGATGLAVVCFVQCVAVTMLVRANRNLKEPRENSMESKEKSLGDDENGRSEA